MTCDSCKQPIHQGAAYSITELGRCHSSCQRLVAHDQLRGPRLVNGLHADPIYVLRRA